jgi:hypothetical protein
MAALLTLVLFSGCVQTPVYSDQPNPARLIIAKGTNGVNMQWKGEKGMEYALYYRDTVGVDTTWKLVPGFERVVGTGKMIEYSDTSPTAKTRSYRVHTLSLSAERFLNKN